MKYYKIVSKDLGRFVPFKSEAKATIFLRDLRFLAFDKFEIVEEEISKEKMKKMTELLWFFDVEYRKVIA